MILKQHILTFLVFKKKETKRAKLIVKAILNYLNSSLTFNLMPREIPDLLSQKQAIGQFLRFSHTGL